MKKRTSVWLTQQGIAEAKRYFSLTDLFDGEHSDLVKHIELALRAHTLFEKDKDYLVQAGEIKLLDKLQSSWCSTVQ